MGMNLKNAFRYQNFLDGLFERITSYLNDSRNLVTVTQKHMRSKSNADAKDESIDASYSRKLDVDNNKMITLLTTVLDEKRQVSLAIAKAKATSEFVLDAEIANNKSRQIAASILSRVGAIKSNEEKSRGTDYKFNAEGNQTSYSYEVEQVTTIDFDRNDVKKLARELSTKSDETSDLIEKTLIETIVNFEPYFNTSDSFEDIAEELAAKESKSE